MLSMIIVIPLIGVVACLIAGRFAGTSARWVALLASLATLAVALAAVTRLPASVGGLTEGIEVGGRVVLWSLRLDGLSAPLVVLTAFLGVIAVLTSWDITQAPGGHHALLLGLQAAVAGVFLAADLVLFYLFWEAVLIPMFFLIGIWGHERRKHAAMKFFIYTFAGSALMLVGIVVLIFMTRQFDISTALQRMLPPEQRTLVFWLLAIGFLVKIPVFPLHTWLPDAHVEAPTAGSVMLAGVLLKMGGYGLIRLGIPVAPDAYGSAQWVLATLGVVGIVYGALMALAQEDLKRLVAYSSVSHMGFVVLAISVGTPLGLGAAMLGMVSHGLVAGMLFFLVGAAYDRTHTREIARFGGLARAMPIWGTAFVFAALASLGLPGLSGFPGEFITVLESFKAYSWWAALPAVGVVVAAGYNLWAVRRVCHNEVRSEWEHLHDMGGREALAASLMAAAVLALGVWPKLVLGISDPALSAIAGVIGGR